MPVTTHERAKAGRTFAVLAGLVAFVAISFLTFDVAREIRLLSSANSDNLQWSLSQTEVEFLEFSKQLDEPAADLTSVRRRFDVFYSRIDTISKASVFETLRDQPAFEDQLASVRTFLEDSVAFIDSDDAVLRAALPALRDRADETRPVVRSLANAGLRLFAENSDNQRQAVASTLTHLAVAIAMLIGTLAFLVFYLNRLNKNTTQREREQKQTATRMNTVIATSLDGVVVCNAEGQIIEFSPAAEAIFGHKFEDIVGKEIGKVIVPGHLRAAHDAGMERMRIGGEKRVVGKGRVALEAVRANGEIFPVELAIQSAFTDEGDIFIAFLRDISKRVAAEAELVAARDKALAGEKLKTDFMTTMSHEIRTPLNGLLGNMDLLRDTSLNQVQDRYVRNMETSGRLLMSHISDVLDITRYDAGKLSTRSEPVDVSSLLQDIVDSQTSMASANETTLDWGWEGDPQHWVQSDYDRLQHVLMNLIGNAVKFTKRGKVSLTAKFEPDGKDPVITFEIRDTGPGISEDLSDRVFDDFVTGNTAYDRDVGGTGLGLGIAKRFVTALNGEIGVDSIVGEGSTFWVKLPVKPMKSPNGKTQRQKSRLLGRSLNVLLVEDNEINRIVAREMLEADGHTVTEAYDGQSGVKIAHTQVFDLILMDISMPIMDGRAATRAIRSGNGSSVRSRIVALTANAVAEEQENFKADGMNGILTKPLSKAALREVVLGQNTEVEVKSADLVDRAHYIEARGMMGDGPFIKLLTRFTGEVEELIDWLLISEKPDRNDIAARAHKVAGSAAVFGAIGLRDHLRQLEDAAKSADNNEVLHMINALPPLWLATKPALI